MLPVIPLLHARLATIAGPAYPSSPRASPRQTVQSFAIRGPVPDLVNESKEHGDEKASNKMSSSPCALKSLRTHHGYIASTTGNSSATIFSFSFTFALVTKITDSTTTPLPITIKRSTRSCRISQPRNTATTGFTYA
jgi:hypothetical protein